MKNGKPVLIVEDDRDIRENLQEVLEFEGFAVLAASHGREALELLKKTEETPGLILLDWMMPVMDGRRFLSALPQEAPNVARNTPVALFTAIGDHGATDVEVAATLRKPIDLDELIELVQSYCT